MNGNLPPLTTTCTTLDLTGSGSTGSTIMSYGSTGGFTTIPYGTVTVPYNSGWTITFPSAPEYKYPWFYTEEAGRVREENFKKSCDDVWNNM